MDGGLRCTDLPVTGSFLKGGWAPTLNLSKDSSKFFCIRSHEPPQAPSGMTVQRV